MEFAEVGGLRLAYEQSGTGPQTVVLAGGSGMPPMVWKICGLQGALEDLGYQVLTYAARGVTPSDAPPPPYAVEDLADDLAGLLEMLEITSCHLVGYSLGGFVAEHLARTRPHLIRSAVLLASAGPATPVSRAVVEVEADLAATLGYLPSAAVRFWELLLNLAPRALRDDPDNVAEWWELLGAHSDSWTAPEGQLGQSAAAAAWLQDTELMTGLSDISMPVLIACFEHDLLFPPAGGQLAATQIPGGQFVEVADAAHGGLVTHPESTIRAIVEFLGQTLIPPPALELT